MTCRCGCRFCYACGAQHGYGGSCSGSVMIPKSYNNDDFYIEEMHTRYNFKWNYYREWLDTQRSSNHMRNLIGDAEMKALEYGILEDEFKILFNALSIIIRSRRLLKSCCVFAFFAFGLDVYFKDKFAKEKPPKIVSKKTHNEKKKLQTQKNQVKQEISLIQNFGSLFENHYSILDRFVSDLLTLIHNFVEKFDEKVENWNQIQLEVKSKIDFINKETENLLDTIKGMEMKEIDV